MKAYSLILAFAMLFGFCIGYLVAWIPLRLETQTLRAAMYHDYVQYAERLDYWQGKVADTEKQLRLWQQGNEPSPAPVSDLITKRNDDTQLR